MRREISQAAVVSGAMVAVAAILHSRQRKNKTSKRRIARISTEDAVMCIPASQTTATDALGAPEVCSAQVEQHIQLLAPEESIKLDVRAVICLEIEAAAEENVPPPSRHCSAEVVRLLDLAVAAAILFLLVATGSFTAETHFVVLLSAMVMAAFAAAGMKQLARSLWSQAPQRSDQARVQGAYSTTRGLVVSSPLKTKLRASAQAAHAQLQLYSAGTIMAASFLLGATYYSLSRQVSQLYYAVQAAAQYAPWGQASSFADCLQAIACLAPDARCSTPLCDEMSSQPYSPAQQSAQKIQQHKPRSLEMSAPEVTPPSALQQLLSCLEALAQVGATSCDGTGGCDGCGGCSSGCGGYCLKPQQEPALLTTTAPCMASTACCVSDSSKSNACMHAPAVSWSGMRNCLEAITALQSAADHEDCQDTQQAAAAAHHAATSSASSCGKSVSSSQVHVRPTGGMLERLVCCLQSVAQLGSHEDL